MTTDEKFWTRVEKTETCWLWTGHMTHDGYGTLRRRKIEQKKMLYAHRYAWMLTHGLIPEGELVLHRCDVRNCVNPEHLFLGSHHTNHIDMAMKERSTLTLTADQVREVRTRWAAGARQVDLAATFGISQSTVSRLVRGVSGVAIR